MDDDLITFLIFLAIAGFSLMGKLLEKRKKAEEPPEAPKPLRPRDMPQTMRRMLEEYREVREARPARRPGEPSREGPREGPVIAVPQRATPLAPARPAVDEELRRMRPEEVKRKIPAPRVAPHTPAEPLQEEDRPRMRPEEVTRKAPAPPVAVPSAAARMAARVEGAGREAARQALHDVVHGAEDEEAERSASAPGDRGRFPVVFRGLGEVRHGLILSEVLGPPISLRPGSFLGPHLTQ